MVSDEEYKDTIDRYLFLLGEEAIGDYVKVAVITDWLLDLRLLARDEQVAVGA